MTKEHHYLFLNEFKLSEELFSTMDLKKIMNFRHNFYSPYEVDLPMALGRLNPFPCELKVFYEEIGFGFLHCNKGEINRILDPVSLVYINLLDGEFKYDKRIRQIAEQNDIENQLLFFEDKSGEFLTIDSKDTNGKNSIYYKNHKLENSLFDFIMKFHKNKEYISDKLFQYG